MHYLCFRAANGRGVQDYTLEDFEQEILPKLNAAGIQIASIGSPIGKIDIRDDEAYQQQLELLERFCQMAQRAKCRLIRMFSFFMPEGERPEIYKEQVIEKLRGFIDIAKRYDVLLIHENEKDIYGDIPERCLEIHQALDAPHFKAAFDFANFVQCGADPLHGYELLANYVAEIHIKDALKSDQSNVLCGTGDGHIQELLGRFFKEKNYEGFLTLEPHLVEFSTLKALEHKPEDVVREADVDGAGVKAFKAQCQALREILAQLGERA